MNKRNVDLSGKEQRSLPWLQAACTDGLAFSFNTLVLRLQTKRQHFPLLTCCIHGAHGKRAQTKRQHHHSTPLVWHSLGCTLISHHSKGAAWGSLVHLIDYSP